MNACPTTYVAVVDDDESICRSLSRLLRAAHFQPVIYLSAEAFLADKKHPKFDCLVLDIQLSGMTGLELSRRLSAVNMTTPIVYITAFDDAAARVEAEAGGCAGFFRKTDAWGSILETITNAVKPKEQQDE